MIYYQDQHCTLYCGDMRVIVPTLEQSITACVTDPPYEFGFMGKSWDKSGISFRADTWAVLLGACLPGAALLSFGGSRTVHRIACAIEDGGWELRDTLIWLYGSGFPKSLDVSKALDKGQEREVIGPSRVHSRGATTAYPKRPGEKTAEQGGRVQEQRAERAVITAPTSPEAKLWGGYGTALKPAFEPIVLARKPMGKNSVVVNVIEHGTGALNIDACRIETGDDLSESRLRPYCFRGENSRPFSESYIPERATAHESGRYPSNLLIDEEAAEQLDEQSGEVSGGGTPKIRYSDKFRNTYGEFKGGQTEKGIGGSSGGASRFFYTAKADADERWLYCRECSSAFPLVEQQFHRHNQRGSGKQTWVHITSHPTVKPLSLMLYLLKMIKMPARNLLLDPFAGSGSTLIAAKRLGLESVGIEQDPEMCEVIAQRLRDDSPLFA